MKTFEITVLVTGTETYEIEAENEDEARRKVWNGESGSPVWPADLALDSIDRVDEVN